MSALINETGKGKVLELLREKVEESIVYKEPIVISIENSFITCLDGVYIANYDVLDDRIYLEDGIELNIMLNEDVEISHEIDGDSHCFKIKHKETEVRLYFT
jgi:hypothetical protein